MPTPRIRSAAGDRRVRRGLPLSEVRISPDHLAPGAEKSSSCDLSLRYSVCTSTTPDTALIAPAICGETLKRPAASFPPRSQGRASCTSDTSPSAPPAAATALACGRAACSARRPGLRHLQPPGNGFQRPGVADENPQALLGLGRGVIQRLGVQHAGADVLALQFGAELQQHRRARLQHVAILRKPFGKQHGLEMAGRVRQTR